MSITGRKQFYSRTVQDTGIDIAKDTGKDSSTDMSICKMYGTGIWLYMK